MPRKLTTRNLPKSPRAPSEHTGKNMSSLKHGAPEIFKPSMRGIGRMHSDGYSCKQRAKMRSRGHDVVV